MGKNSQRTEEIELLCRLSESELEEEAKKLTELIVEKSRQEADRKSISAAYGEHIKKLEEKIEDQVPIVADRQKRKMVSCLIEYNKPSLGKKTVTRLDLNTVVGVYDMTEDEKQDIFYNSETDDTIDVPAVKLLPAGADEVPIHLEKSEPGKDDNTELEVGKRYEIEGTVYRCVENAGQCDGCAFENDEDRCAEYCLGCSPGIFKAEDASAAEAMATPEDKPAEEEKMEQTEEMEEPDAAENHKCEDCGLVPAAGFVWLMNKWLCKACNDKRNRSKMDCLPMNDLKGLKIRASHYNGVTNFRFIMRGKTSWGNPINLFGDFSDPNTESDALEFYHELKKKGCIDA